MSWRGGLVGAVAVALAGCGWPADFVDPGWYRCELPDGTVRRYHTDDLRAYLGVGTDPWLVDRRTGRRLPEMQCAKEQP